MEVTTLKKEQISLINSFEEVDFKDATSILSWFNKACNCKMIFENFNFVNHICDKLKENGYTEYVEPKVALSNFRKLIGSQNEDKAEEIAKSLIEQIITSLRKNYCMETSFIYLIQLYNEKFNKVQAYDFMMKRLEENVGKFIILTLFRSEESFLQTGILQKLEKYNYVIINGEKIPFIGYNIAISAIYDEFNNLLFSNKSVSKLENLKDTEEIQKRIAGVFGSEEERMKKSIA